MTTWAEPPPTASGAIARSGKGKRADACAPPLCEREPSVDGGLPLAATLSPVSARHGGQPDGATPPAVSRMSNSPAAMRANPRRDHEGEHGEAESLKIEVMMPAEKDAAAQEAHTAVTPIPAGWSRVAAVCVWWSRHQQLTSMSIRASSGGGDNQYSTDAVH